MAALILLLVAAARAESPIERAQEAELDRLRASVTDEIHLAAFDLLDELVYGWTTDPVFPTDTPVVLAGVTVPVGLGTGLQALLENHVTSVILANPTTHVALVHCPSCSAMVVHSGPEATIVSRGIDDPTVLAELGADATGRHALFLDLEAEGTFLVLRARLTRLTPELPIVWSHTISTSASTPALLRDPEHLTSAAEAREEYLDALRDRGPISVPLRVGIRSYAQQEGGEGVPPPPFLWVETGVELGVTQAQAWTASVVGGYSFIPQAYQGILVQGRVNRLITGAARSHVRPDLYGFVGAAAISVWGPGTASFSNPKLTEDEVLAGARLEDVRDPRTSFGAIQVGLDLRVGQRMGVAAFLERMPAFGRSRNIGDHVRIFGIGFQSLGTEVTFWF